MQEIGRPIWRQIRAVSPNRTDMLSPSTEIVVLAVHNIVVRKNYLPLRRFNGRRNGRFVSVDEITTKEQHPKRQNKKKQENRTSFRRCQYIFHRLSLSLQPCPGLDHYQSRSAVTDISFSTRPPSGSPRRRRSPRCVPCPG